jgi:hypothetical protein
MAVTNLKQLLGIVVLLLAIAGAAGSLWYTQWRTPEHALDSGTLECATVLAEKTSALLQRRGQVAVLSRDPQICPGAKTDLAAFRQTLKQLGAVNVAATEFFTEAQLPSPLTMPGALFLAAAEHNPDVDAIVSFVGVPELTPVELRRAKTAGRKLVVLSPAVVDARPLFEQGVLQVLIMPRAKLPAGNPRQLKTARERFDYYYDVLTAP